VKRAASSALRSHASMSMTCTALFNFTPVSGLSMALVVRRGSWLFQTAAQSQYALEFCYTWSPTKVDVSSQTNCGMIEDLGKAPNKARHSDRCLINI